MASINPTFNPDTRTHTCLALLITLLTLCSTTLANNETINHPLSGATAVEIASAYGSEQRYTITRNGKNIGQHKLTFVIDGNNVTATVESSIKVRILAIPVYSLSYSAQENWKDNLLISATATTIENGERNTVSLDNNNTSTNVPYASNHWHPGVLSGQLVFNTLTGNNDQLTVLRVGSETLTIKNKGSTDSILATRYRYTGDLNLDVWYDSDGLWVQMIFAGEDGSRIQYQRQL